MLAHTAGCSVALCPQSASPWARLRSCSSSNRLVHLAKPPVCTRSPLSRDTVAVSLERGDAGGHQTVPLLPGTANFTSSHACTVRETCRSPHEQPLLPSRLTS